MLLSRREATHRQALGAAALVKEEQCCYLISAMTHEHLIFMIL